MIFLRSIIALCLAITLCAPRFRGAISDIFQPLKELFPTGDDDNKCHQYGDESNSDIVDGVPAVEVLKATRCSANEQGQERCCGKNVQECAKENGGNHYVWKVKEGCQLSQSCECWTIESCRCAPKLLPSPSGLFVQDGWN